MSVVLELKGVSKTYKQGRLYVEALRDINMKIYEGEFVAILGPSGSGKSTLMNLLGCLDKPTMGEFFLGGKDVASLSKKDLIKFRQEIGFVFQKFNLIQRLNVMENIEVSLMIQDTDVPAERKKKIQTVLEHLGLSKRKEHNPTELSGGQQQRVAIARAMIRKPKYFLLDEPTGNVDTQNRDIIMKLIKKLNQTKNITTILITHDLKLAEMADTVYYLVDGEFVGKDEFEKPLVANGSRN